MRIEIQYKADEQDIADNLITEVYEHLDTLLLLKIQLLEIKRGKTIDGYFTWEIEADII